MMSIQSSPFISGEGQHMNCQGESGSYEGVDEYNTWSSLRLSTPMFSEMFVQVDDLYGHQLFFNQVYINLLSLKNQGLAKSINHKQ